MRARVASVRMTIACIVLLRHGEREDRHAENEGRDWISTAEVHRLQIVLLFPLLPFLPPSTQRPQDPMICETGVEQVTDSAHSIKRIILDELLGGSTTHSLDIKVISSPLVRTVMSSDVLCKVLQLPPKSIHIDPALVEQARSLRGTEPHEPKPVFPIYQSIESIIRYSNQINSSYAPLIEDIRYEKDLTKANHIREVHNHLTDENDITADRCRIGCLTMLHRYHYTDDASDNDDTKRTVLILVGHGASIKSFANALLKVNNDNNTVTDNNEEILKSDNPVACWGAFVPSEAGAAATWKSISKEWFFPSNVTYSDNSKDRGK